MLLPPAVGAGAGAGALAITLYAVALFYARKLWREQLTQYNRLLRILIAFGLLLHGLSLISLIWRPNGFNAGLFAMLSASSATTLAIAFSASYWRPALNALTPILLIAAIVCVPISHFFETNAPLNDLTVAQSGHILLSITAWGTLIVAFVQSLMASIQSKSLKNHHANPKISLPPLQTTEKILFESLALGWCLLSLSMATGFIAFDDFFGQHLAHKAFFTVLAWILLTAVLFGHWFAGWRGHHALRLTRWGIALMLVGYLGSKIALELIIQ
ncbi:MAG: cytochrome c biogenesis protein CcsA [Gammaproteobacteria bacterium]